MQGAMPEEVEIKLDKILQGADPPQSEPAVAELLADAGFEPPLRFFASLFWGAWMAKRRSCGRVPLRAIAGVDLHRRRAYLK
ncbi:MAG: hypothetical protein P4L98_04795 [Ancalomicrobiaceae bacterium]|nr:hypothetical protein [Ancalomicrobiaceae bacterium]